MARPTKQQSLNAKVEESENLIRESLVDLTKVLLDTALNAPLKVTCVHCRKGFDVPRVGDPRVAMSLLERIAGKATEKKPETSTTAIERLIMGLAGETSTPATPGATTSGKTPAQQAAEALALANTRAALRAAAVTP